MSKKLKKLLKSIPFQEIRGSKEIDITGICSNSKRVSPGNLFVAKKGLTNDGSRYIEEAISSGASAILTDLYDPFVKVTQLIDSDVLEKEAQLVTHFYDFPSQELFIVGITGTNGKTSVAYYTKYLLDQLYGPCGMIGTIEYVIGGLRHPASRTTPDVTANHKMLRDMVCHGCRSAVMEVSSHGLHQNRVGAVDFDVAIFTNLSSEHLDYHHSMEEYAEAKSSLFTNLKEDGVAIVNVDDPYHKRMLQDCKAKTFTFGIEAEADLRAKNILFDSAATAMTLVYDGEERLFSWSNVGRFNIYNALAAIAVGLVRGYSLEEVSQVVESAQAPPGRMESVPNEHGLKIYVDYSHTPDSLEQALRCAREFCRGRLIVLFGCGGDRDKEKRPKMGEIAEELADLVFITSDNPRSEDPETICKEIRAGMKSNSSALVVDRRHAIQFALMEAEEEDVVLIAGKGHETHQVFAHHTVEFDDRKVVEEICKKICEEVLVY